MLVAECSQLEIQIVIIRSNHPTKYGCNRLANVQTKKGCITFAAYWFPEPASAKAPGGATRRAPLGTLFGARSGDKGGNANLGIFARSDDAFVWLDSFLTVERVRELLPEVADLAIDRHPLPNIRSINFVLHGLLEEGVAASTRQDGQAKSLGEWLRARVVEIPEALLP